MMSQRSKREMIEAIRPRYLKANKTGKAHILDELIATTGYHRKYAIRVLKHSPKAKGLQKPGRRKVYQGEVVAVSQVGSLAGGVAQFHVDVRVIDAGPLPAPGANRVYLPQIANQHCDPVPENDANVTDTRPTTP